MSKHNKIVTDIKDLKWDRYFGNNHYAFPFFDRRDVFKKGGSVSFKNSLGKPLNDELWDDLLYRFQIAGLRIYYHDQERWTDGHLGKFCIIELNDDNTINDIEIYP